MRVVGPCLRSNQTGDLVYNISGLMERYGIEPGDMGHRPHRSLFWIFVANGRGRVLEKALHGEEKHSELHYDCEHGSDQGWRVLLLSMLDHGDTSQNTLAIPCYSKVQYSCAQLIFQS